MESRVDLTGLVDTDRIVTVEKIDSTALPDRKHGVNVFSMVKRKEGYI